MNSSSTNRFKSSRIAEARLWRCGETESWETPSGQRDLPEAGAHAWLCPLTRENDLVAFISPEEAARAENFIPESKANEFTQSRGWLRILLAYYANLTEPGSIRIGIAEYGKPYALDFPGLHFSLSHSFDWVAIAFSRHEVGIDIEKLRRVPDWRDLAQGLLPPEISAKISALSAGQQESAFLEQFTAREAYLKALGEGLAGSGFPGTPENCKITELPEIPGGYTGHVCVTNVTRM